MKEKNDVYPSGVPIYAVMIPTQNVTRHIIDVLLLKCNVKTILPPPGIQPGSVFLQVHCAIHYTMEEMLFTKHILKYLNAKYWRHPSFLLSLVLLHILLPKPELETSVGVGRSKAL